MNRTQATPGALPASDAVSIYDRFTGLYDLMFRVNGYGRSLERYLRERPLPLAEGARVLDAGCGTGLLTLALLRVLDKPVSLTAVDLSHSSLLTARRAISGAPRRTRTSVYLAQANVLALPFPDESFDCVVTSGVLEYVPLREGFRELARVVVPGGYLLHLPVRPSPASKLLELLFDFKTRPPSEVDAHTATHFQVIDRHHFSPLEPIGWTKLAILSRKKVIGDG
ncbi:MAG TPA: methyltransferase domain-containing protein [Pyrinomonadaceae bacterium]|nr:methyltransferase domain-containing protein [Pyrinomonadaceae bacterium]